MCPVRAPVILDLMTYLNGLDISEFQASVPSLTNQSFVLCRATDGLITDAKWASHAPAIKAAGLVLGAYHFGYGSVIATPEAQAQAFLRVATPLTRWLMLDVERAKYAGTSMTTDEAVRFVAEVHREGFRCGLYHSLSGYPSVGQDWDAVADWGATPPSRPWDIWQYGSSKLVPGVDGDYFDGTLEQLKTLAGESTVILPTDTPTELLDIAYPPGVTSGGPTAYEEDFTTQVVPRVSVGTYAAYGITRKRSDGLALTPILVNGRVGWVGMDWVQNRRLTAAPPLPDVLLQLKAFGSQLSSIASAVNAIRAKTDRDLV